MNDKEHSAHILVVDDDPDILSLIRYILEQTGYRVETAFEGHDALRRAAIDVPDLMVVDLMMPGMDGVELCRRIRQDVHLRETPILILTALSNEISEIESLDAGADDYVTKPIAPKLFLSHVRALLRRSSRTESSADVLQFDNLTIDRTRYVVIVDNGDELVEMQLPRKEFELLHFLAANPGRVFTRAELLDQVWGSDVFVIDRTVDVHIRKIREKLSSDYIVTVRGRGYKFKT